MNKIRIIDNLSLDLDIMSAYIKYGNLKRLPYKKRNDGVVNILGTGPSLKNSLNTILKDDGIIPNVALNDFALSALFEQLRPRYYMFLDPAYFINSDSISDRDSGIRENVFNNIKEITNWEMTLIIPATVARSGWIEKNICNPLIDYLPVCFADLTLVDSNKFYKMLEKNRAAKFQNVLAAAIYVCINLGYDEIRLFGAEHSWTKDLRVNDQNQVCTVYKHFYEEEEILVPWMTSKNTPFTMDSIMNAFYKVFRAYSLLAKYAEMKSCKVINYTPDSFIDAFERKVLIKQ